MFLSDAVDVTVFFVSLLASIDDASNRYNVPLAPTTEWFKINNSKMIF